MVPIFLATRYSHRIRPQTPALLQLSGIGDSSILGPLGITTKINLKTVGKNLQEQVC
jgi:choline dehydrogenase-like flavoprotein